MEGPWPGELSNRNSYACTHSGTSSSFCSNALGLRQVACGGRAAVREVLKFNRGITARRRPRSPRTSEEDIDPLALHVDGTCRDSQRSSFMSWMRTSPGPASHTTRAKDTILENVHRGLLLATAARRLQDAISARRASAEARQLLTTVKKLCEETPYPDSEDERVRVAIASLTQALESDDRR